MVDLVQSEVKPPQTCLVQSTKLNANFSRPGKQVEIATIPAFPIFNLINTLNCRDKANTITSDCDNWCESRDQNIGQESTCSCWKLPAADRFPTVHLSTSSASSGKTFHLLYMNLKRYRNIQQKIAITKSVLNGYFFKILKSGTWHN